MENKDLLYLQDIQDQIDLINTFIINIAFDDFIEDAKTIYSVIRALEIIGEATKRISANFRDTHSEIPWKKIAGMRDMLIHDYTGIDSEIVWKTIEQDIPILQSFLKKHLNF